jgi:hypothetical protein
MTAYANQKALLINRVVREADDYAHTVTVAASGADYTSVTAALAAIAANALGYGLPAVDHRIRILVSDGTYTETDTINFGAANCQYVDLCGTSKAGTIINNATSAKDVIIAGGCFNMIRDITVNQTTTGTAAYGLHLDGNSAGATSSITVIYNCVFTATKKSGIGLGMYNTQTVFLIDVTATCSQATGIVSNGLYGHPIAYGLSYSESGGRLAIVGGTYTGVYGIGWFNAGSQGFPQVMLSGCTLTAAGEVATGVGGCDLLVVGPGPKFTGTSRIPTSYRSWTAESTYLAMNGVLNSNVWYYNVINPGSYPAWSDNNVTYNIWSHASPSIVTNGGLYYSCLETHTTSSGVSVFADDLAAGKWVRIPQYFWFTLYYSNKADGTNPGWILFPSYASTAAAMRPDYFEAARTAASPTAWATGTAYVVGDVRSSGGVTYFCSTAHTSDATAFANDYDATDVSKLAKWVPATTLYFYTTKTQWIRDESVTMTGLGAFSSSAPAMTTARTSGVNYKGFADETVFLMDQASPVTFTNSGSQASLSALKNYAFLNTEKKENVNNGILTALAWLDAGFDPAYPAATDVVSGVDRGDGTLGTDPRGGGMLEI